IARDTGVPLVAAPPLARALYRHVDLGQEIPVALYAAVAQVLTYLLQVRLARRTGAAPPPLPDISLDVEQPARAPEGRA
ncbi:MAG: EscU/YscU/HrcU family type III secretion system export apparatus switch protein, partial [Steroidobacteraceae bacterium]|nr:EscU/YscU/HrcU family type III secretion system export apparatus switch protein [Steroidobacteraceae bacterium]